MAALAQDVNASTVGPTTTIKMLSNGADTYYRGALLYQDAATGGVQPTWGSGDIAVGFSPTNQVTTASGEEVAVVIQGAIWLPVGTALAVDDEGDYLMNDGPANTDNPADLESASDLTLADGDMYIGRILRVTSTQMLIFLSPGLTGMLHNTSPTNGWGQHI